MARTRRPAEEARTPVDYLDPTIDFAPNLLLVREPRLLHDMIEAVLGRPVHEVRVLNPEITREQRAAKSIVLDVRIALASGEQIDLEMQAHAHPALAQRALHSWVRLHGNSLQAGESYALIRPTISIVWVAESFLTSHRFHSVISLLEESTHEKLTDDLQMHFLELAKLSPDDDADPRLLRWARFFTARDEASFTALTQEDPAIMALATQTLAALSGDPTRRTAAEERKMSQAFEAAGFVAAEARGKALGREETLRLTVGILCRALGIAFTTAREKRVATMSGERLEALVRDLEAERAWPGQRRR